MAHIIAFMDESLHIGTSGLVAGAFPAQVRRRHSRTPHLKAAQDKVPVMPADAGVDVEEVRMDRVNELRAAIADGSYKVSAADLADRILHTMLKK